MDKNVGYLLIHGFGGNIGEVLPLYEYLREHEYRVECPVLKGHTGRRRDLRGVKYHDWIKSAEESLLSLSEEYDCIYVIGFSMGGLIAINLAVKYEVDAVITINTPIYYWDFKRIFLNIIGDFQKRRSSSLRRYAKSSGRFPFSALINFRLLLQRTKPKIKDLNCPFLVLQALDDDTVRKDSASYIYRNLVSTEKNLKYYENGGHQILRSPAAGRVIADIEEFNINLSKNKRQNAYRRRWKNS